HCLSFKTRTAPRNVGFGRLHFLLPRISIRRAKNRKQQMVPPLPLFTSPPLALGFPGSQEAVHPIILGVPRGNKVVSPGRAGSVPVFTMRGPNVGAGVFS